MYLPYNFCHYDNSRASVYRQAISKIYWMKETATFFFPTIAVLPMNNRESHIYIYVLIAVIICERWMQKTYRSHWNKFQVILVEEQRPEKIQRRSTPTTQKVWQQIQIAKYPQITYSTFGSTNCGVSDLVRCDFWRGWGVFWIIKFQHFRTGLKLWKIISFYLIRQMG